MGNTLQEHRIQIGIFNNNSQTLRGGWKKKTIKIKSNKCSKGMDIKILLITFLFLIGSSTLGNTQTNANISLNENLSFNFLPNSVKLLKTNFESRYKYDNKKKNGIKIMHWNAGGKHLLNKLENIESVINGYKPHILGISEANFFRKHDVQDVQIENYQLFFSDTLNNEALKVSRIAVYVHNDIACKVRKDLMNDSFSSIWLEINLPRQKKFLVCHAYREWQYMNQVSK
jgi:hypothetical protein